MQNDPHPLNYCPVPPAEPRRWLLLMRTAAMLCPAALAVDCLIPYDAMEARPVTHVEVALAIFGTTCAIVSAARGLLTRGDKLAVAACLLLFAFTAYVGLLMPRVIHN